MESVELCGMNLFSWHFQLLVDKDPGLVGNLLVERLVGAHIDLVSKEEYGKIGSVVSSSTVIVISCFVVLLGHLS
jgi:hypothetical protein